MSNEKPKALRSAPVLAAIILVLGAWVAVWWHDQKRTATEIDLAATRTELARTVQELATAKLVAAKAQSALADQLKRTRQSKALAELPTVEYDARDRVLSVDRPPARSAGPEYGQVWTFGDKEAVAVGQQGSRGRDPRAGIVQVTSGGPSRTRTLELTHYQYGGTLSQSGYSSNVFEMWLGDAGVRKPSNFSVRNNGSGQGAIVQARDEDDLAGVMLDFRSQARAVIGIEDNGALPGTQLAIRNPQARGTISLATKRGGRVQDRFTVRSDGALDAHGNRLANLVVDSSDELPKSPVAGQLFYRTDQRALYVFAGTWKRLAFAAYP